MSTSMDEVSKLLRNGAFNPLDDTETKKQREQIEAENYRMACEVAAAFKTQQGKRTLRLMVERFMDPPTWVPVSTNIDDATAYGFSREGQKSVVQWIQQCITRAESGPPTSEVKHDGNQ